QRQVEHPAGLDTGPWGKRSRTPPPAPSRSRRGPCLCLGDPLDRRQGGRDPGTRLPRAQLDALWGSVAVLVVEHLDALGAELPGLGQPGAVVPRLEDVPPPHEPAADEPRELAAAFSGDHLRPGLPGCPVRLVAAV